MEGQLVVESMGDSNVGAVESCRGWCWEVVVQFIQQFTSRTIKPPELICFCFAPSHVARILLSYKRNCFCVCFPASQEHIMPAIPDKNGKIRSPSCDHCWIKDGNIYIGQWIHFRLASSILVYLGIFSMEVAITSASTFTFALSICHLSLILLLGVISSAFTIIKSTSKEVKIFF